jgi:hypothetical protein
MKSYRLNSVSFKATGNLPVLVACPRDKADGLVVVEAEGTTKRIPYVRLIDFDALKKFVEDPLKFQEEYGVVPDKTSLRILGFRQLAEALKTRDDDAYEFACRNLAKHSVDPYQTLALRRQPSFELARFVAKGLRHVELVIWWREEDLDQVQVMDLGLRCPDTTAALYALAAMSIVGGGEGIGACLKCGKALVRQRRTKKFCSDKCRYDMHMSRSPKESKK